MKQIKPIQSPDMNQPLTAELLGKAIKAKRTQSHLRLEDAAALCDVAKQTLMKIEHGQATTQFSSILQTCAGLGIKLFIEPWNEEHDDWK